MAEATCSSGKRLLLVDDHLPSQKVFGLALTMRGYTCVLAERSEDALVAIVRFQPHVVLLEWRLPGGSGLGLATRLRDRASQQLREIIVVAVSTADEVPGFRAAETFDAYLTKPVTVDVIEAMLEQMGSRQIEP